MDNDLDAMSRRMIVEIKKLRQGVRQHRDSSLHELCWHQPQLWGLLPEPTDPLPVVPDLAAIPARMRAGVPAIARHAGWLGAAVREAVRGVRRGTLSGNKARVVT